MRFADILMAVATQAGGVAAPAGPLWSAVTTGAIADPAAWTQTGTLVTITGGKMAFAGGGNTNFLTLAGAYLTALAAAVPLSTTFRMEVDIADWVFGASARLRLHQAAAANYGTITGNGTQSFSITSGASAGLVFFGNSCTYSITDIRIYSS